jgi:DNA-binding transcriptional ArsR family regulator
LPDDLLARQLKALSDRVRLRILELLPTKNECPDVYNVSELATELRLSQPTVSHHLAILKRAGIVKSEKMCRDVYHWVDRSALGQVRRAIRDLER